MGVPLLSHVGGVSERVWRCGYGDVSVAEEIRGAALIGSPFISSLTSHFTTMIHREDEMLRPTTCAMKSELPLTSI